MTTFPEAAQDRVQRRSSRQPGREQGVHRTRGPPCHSARRGGWSYL